MYKEAYFNGKPGEMRPTNQGGKPKPNCKKPNQGGFQPNKNFSHKPKKVGQKFSEMSISNVNPEILKGLECPICMEPMMSEILMCESGHSICSTCSKSLLPPVCPMCRTRITLQRNYHLEGMAQSIKVPCKFAENGCKFSFVFKDLEEHQNKCHFDKVFCPVGKIVGSGCSWNDRKNMLMAHVKDAHPENAKYNFKEMQIDKALLNKVHTDMQVFVYESKVFIFHTFVNIYEKILYFACQCMANESAASNYKYTVHVYNKAQPLKKIEISEVCTSDASSVNDLFTSGNCIGLPLSVIANYIPTNGEKLSFKLFTNSQKKDGE